MTHKSPAGEVHGLKPPETSSGRGGMPGLLAHEEEASVCYLPYQ